jgi:hypothetical protein
MQEGQTNPLFVVVATVIVTSAIIVALAVWM